MEKKMFIYIIKNKVNGKRYVGKTTIGVEHRWKKHLVDTFNNKLYAYNSYFHRAIRKYGVENFEFEEIYSNNNPNIVITEEDLNNYEKYFIDYYRTFIGFEDCNGYNMTRGGEGWTGIGKYIDVYDKELNFITTYDSIEETARQLNLQTTNISAVVNKRMVSTGGFIFCENGTEPLPYKNKTNTMIDVYSLEGKYIKTFSTMKSAAEFIGVNITTVFDCCNQKQLRCRNYICVYSGDKLEDRRKSKAIAKKVDVYCAKTKRFLKTYDTIVSLKKELKLWNSVVNRCLGTNNHLAGDYLIVPHGIPVE
jgi:hypothetical protein